MAASNRRPKLIAIVGPTASGKSALALKIAKKYGGEIICADSRTIYKGMDIGTAKPTSVDQQKVTHWGIDLVGPGERYSVHKFKGLAEEKIESIWKRDKLPIMVGGTGLYIDAVLFDYKFSSSGRGPLRQDAIIIGLMPSPEILRQRINHRVEQMFASGFMEEVKALYKKYGDSLKIGAGIGYNNALAVIKGQMTTQAAITKTKSQTWQYARRQKTWFKRNPKIQWFSSADAAYKFVVHRLNN